MATMEQLLREAVEKNASDLHLSAGQPPRLRVDGDLAPLDYPVMTPEEVMTCVDFVITPEHKARFVAEHELDLACAIDDIGRFRVNVFMQNRGPGAVLRRIPTIIPSLESLGLPPIFHELCERERGLVLVTGPTGSGKSTTLAAMVDHINRHAGTPHPHHRGPDRVRAPAEALPGQPARGRAAHRAPSPTRCKQRAPRGPRRDPGRRDARPRDDLARAHRRRDRAPRVRHAAHHERAEDDRPHHRRVPRRASRARSAPCSRSRSRP